MSEEEAMMKEREGALSSGRSLLAPHLTELLPKALKGKMNVALILNPPSLDTWV